MHILYQLLVVRLCHNLAALSARILLGSPVFLNFSSVSASKVGLLNCLANNKLGIFTSVDNYAYSSGSGTMADTGAAAQPPTEEVNGLSVTEPVTAAEAPAAASPSAPAAAAAPVMEEKPHPSGISLEERFQIARSVAEECINDDELKRLLNNKPNPVAYDGFEPSGRMHIAQGVMKCINVNRLTKVGCTFKFWVADWFAQLNNKMGGDLKKIQTVGRYMVEVWKAVGMDLTNVEFLSSSEEINKRPDEYWTLVMDIARKNNLKRILRCSQIMGRNETDELSAAQVFYPCMQCADVFFLKVGHTMLGMFAYNGSGGRVHARSSQ